MSQVVVTMEDPPTYVPVHLISATYGPCPGRRLFNGEITGGSINDPTRIPFSRDVLPVLRHFLGEGVDEAASSPATKCADKTTDGADFVGGLHEVNDHESISDLDGDVGTNKKRKRRQPRRRVAFPLLEAGLSMNVAFGDPCPGTTKILTIQYSFTDESAQTISTATFREHERIILRRSNLIQETETTGANRTLLLKNAKSTSITADESALAVAEPWGLRTEVSELVLPLLLPYLEIRRRAKCQMVCKSWRSIITDMGVATSVDINDPSIRNKSRKFLRGIIAQSYSSLCSLILNDISDLAKDDLHPAFPHLTKLTTLDISRCTNMNNSTLLLISEHLGDRLEVLYIKGLTRVTDEGFLIVCKSCRLLRVLEISAIPKITDHSGTAIGENLPMLEALYMRDNYQLTNESIDRITSQCKKLSLLTLWGCIRLKNLVINHEVGDGSNQVVMLNLWGCHGLGDDIAEAIGRMPNLRSLNVAECHNLTDSFIARLSQSSNASQIEHVNLRYLMQLTDSCTPALVDKMTNLRSIDLSFCTKLSTAALTHMIRNAPALTELRLWNCHQIDLTIRQSSVLAQGESNSNFDEAERNGADGRLLVNSIQSRSIEKSRLILLDLRKFVGHHRSHKTGEVDPTFLQGMSNLGFEQKVELFFTRHHALEEKSKYIK